MKVKERKQKDKTGKKQKTKRGRVPERLKQRVGGSNFSQ